MGDILYRIVGWSAGLSLGLLIVIFFRTLAFWAAQSAMGRFVLSTIAAAIGILIGYAVSVAAGVLVNDVPLILCYLIVALALIQAWRVRYD